MGNTETINILSLCTGYGGLELGISGALEGVFRVVAVEVEAYALANLAAKAQEGKLAVEAMWPDLKTFPAQRFRGCFDIILAGYPCQPFSVAGKRQGTDDPRHLWPDIAQIVEAVRPVWCFLENVPGHLTIGYPEVYCQLRNLGYKVEAGLFTAAEVGAPHKRQRLFILANRSGYVSGGLTAGIREEAGKGIKQAGQSRQVGDNSGNNGELADAALTHSERKRQLGNDVSLPRSEEMADARCNQQRRISRNGRKEDGLAQKGKEADRRDPQLERGRWPARPGQRQYEWEEPRVVVGDAGGGKRAGVPGNERQEISEAGKTGEGQAQSRLGGAVDGACRRVDRLRLLGNGVIPQQAEKAFRELIRLF